MRKTATARFAGGFIAREDNAAIHGSRGGNAGIAQGATANATAISGVFATSSRFRRTFKNIATHLLLLLCDEGWSGGIN